MNSRTFKKPHLEHRPLDGEHSCSKRVSEAAKVVADIKEMMQCKRAQQLRLLPGVYRICHHCIIQWPGRDDNENK